MLEIDNMLAKCGDFNRYQFMLLFFFCIINILSSMQYYSQTIISFVPQHWCYDESLVNLSSVQIESRLNDVENPSCNKLNTTEKCSKWIYNYDYGYHSMTSDLNWICDSAWKSTLGQSMYFIGSMIGSLLLGILSDHIGRVPVIVIAYVFGMIGNISTIFATTVPIFSICRFISGLATDSNFVMMYILVLEYIRPSMRTYGLSICIGLFYCLGSAITPWVAVAVGNWKMFLLAVGLPSIIVPLFSFFVAESPQWLITTKQYDKAVKCLKRVAKVNKINLDESVYDEFIAKCSKTMAGTRKNANLLGLFKTPRLRKNTLILFFKSMVITLCYDAISRNVEGLGVSPFTMFSLSATAILPACILLILLQDKIGRKAMASSSLFVSGIFTATAGIIIIYQETKNPFILVTLSIIGRFGVTVAYNSAAQYATELIPTSIRGQGVAVVHVAGYAFTFFSSYILFLQIYFPYLPALILGILSLMGAVLSLLLPETLNRTLPVTLDQAEQFGKNEKIFDFSCFENKRSTSTLTLPNAGNTQNNYV